MTEDRRSAPRIAASLAGELESSAGNATIAITRDVSASGLLLYTRLDLAIGDAVKLKVICGGDTIVLSGKVVRKDEVEDSTLWRTKVAVAVETGDPSLAKVLT